VNGAIRSGAQRWLDSGVPAVVVEVVEARGSVPRETGTRMVVSREEVLGTIGGGHLELKAIAFARGRLSHPEPAEQHFALGPALGQCCGGAVTLRYAPLSAPSLAAWPAPAPRFALQLYGAGHVGRAIVEVLAQIDCRVQWIDERESEFPQGSPLPPHIERLCVEPVEAEVPLAPPGAFYLVLTHSHDLDQAITEAILKRGDFGFLGLIGSQTKRARFVRRFQERGIAPEVLARMTCPIGVPGVGGKEPGVIAVAVVAQLLQASSPGADAQRSAM
jgi:xanthine dehydrogenase accessory factor